MQDDHRLTRRTRLVAAGLLTASLMLGTVPAASADKGDRAFPSERQVADAKRKVAQKTRAVGAIQASLLLANQRLEQAALEAEKASEAYNGAMWRLEVARQELAEAREEARQARAAVADQRKAIGVLVAASYQQGSEIAALTSMLSADGPQAMMDRYAAFQGASESLQADFERFAASDTLAAVFERRAAEARQRQQKLAEEARDAKDDAAAAAARAQSLATRIAAEKEALIRELARAQKTSVALARKRQTALEEIARKKAEQRARAEAEAAAEARDRAEARARARARTEARKRARAKRAEERRKERRRQQQSNPAPEPAPEPAPAPAPAPKPAPKPAPAPAPSGGADRAIAFAKAQLGEPYVWGAAGPDSWDCSGLTLAAWGAAGKYLPHYSVAQYYAGTPISASSLRPGDLVFWGSTSSPDSIHHVALYIGGGQIIHAPRTGRPVSIESMYYWIPPNFFARV